MSNFWRDRSVLVTGATGFLGGCLVARLVGLGAATTCVIRGRRAWEILPMGVSVVLGNVTDQSFMERVIGESQTRTVFHLAAQAQVGVANHNPVSTFDTNVRGTWAVLEACRRSPLVEQVIVSSSDKAYGEQPRLPYTEDMPLLGVNPYDASKACADRLAQTYATQWGVPVTITRCGNLFGGGDRTWSRLVPGTTRRLLRNERPIIHGDGNAFRDWLYVEDAVDAYLMLGEQFDSIPKGDAFNLSLGIQLTPYDIVWRITVAIGANLSPILDGKPIHGEICAQALDCTKARETLGWRPKHTMEEGLAKATAWYRENL